MEINTISYALKWGATGKGSGWGLLGHGAFGAARGFTSAWLGGSGIFAKIAVDAAINQGWIAADSIRNKRTFEQWIAHSSSSLALQGITGGLTKVTAAPGSHSDIMTDIGRNLGIDIVVEPWRLIREVSLLAFEDEEE